jgi:hypothetical protein
MFESKISKINYHHKHRPIDTFSGDITKKTLSDQEKKPHIGKI